MAKSKKISKKTAKKSMKVDKERFQKVLKSLVFWVLLFFVSLVVVDYVVQYLNYHASVAVVNGERISRREFYEDLEQRYGTTIASQMIDEVLVYQEAEEQGVSISNEAIDSEVEQLEQEYGGEDVLNEELKSLGITREQLRRQIETTLLVEKLLKDEIEITDEEAQEFFDQYKSSLFPDNEDITFEEGREEVEDALTDQKIAQEVQPWLSEIRSDARIQNNIESPKSYTFLGITRDFISEILK